MKAVLLSQTGGPQVLTYVNVPDVRPSTVQALIDLQAIWVNHTLSNLDALAEQDVSTA